MYSLSTMPADSDETPVSCYSHAREGFCEKKPGLRERSREWAASIPYN